MHDEACKILFRVVLTIKNPRTTHWPALGCYHRAMITLFLRFSDVAPMHAIARACVRQIEAHAAFNLYTVAVWQFRAG